jgi:hypothetical protein
VSRESREGAVVEVLSQPASWFRMSYCEYCIHERQAHANDGTCLRCAADGNGFWPECVRFTRIARTPEEVAGHLGAALAPPNSQTGAET